MCAKRRRGWDPVARLIALGWKEHFEQYNSLNENSSVSCIVEECHSLNRTWLYLESSKLSLFGYCEHDGRSQKATKNINELCNRNSTFHRKRFVASDLGRTWAESFICRHASSLSCKRSRAIYNATYVAFNAEHLHSFLVKFTSFSIIRHKGDKESISMMEVPCLVLSPYMLV